MFPHANKFPAVPSEAQIRELIANCRRRASTSADPTTRAFLAGTADLLAREQAVRSALANPTHPGHASHERLTRLLDQLSRQREERLSPAARRQAERRLGHTWLRVKRLREAVHHQLNLPPEGPRGETYGSEQNDLSLGQGSS